MSFSPLLTCVMTNIRGELTLDMYTQFEVDYAGIWVLMV